MPIFMALMLHVESQSPRVKPYPDLRYVIHYRALNRELLSWCERAGINLLHWHGPFYGYTGLPERSRLPSIMSSAKEAVGEAHKRGMAILFYIGPVFSYGDPERRTVFFEFFDKRWGEWEDYLGPKPPGDFLDWAQRDPRGKPRPYVYRGRSGFYLCVNNPAVRRYDKALIRLIHEAGADGVFFDGPAFRGGACYCRYCREKFRDWLKRRFTGEELREKFGVEEVEEVNPPTESKGPLWLEWKRFMAFSLYDFIREMRSYGRSLDPKFVVTANYCMWEGNPVRRLSGVAEDIWLWSLTEDIVFDEGQYGRGPEWRDGLKRSNSADYKYLWACSHGKPVAVLKTQPESKSPEGQKALTKLALAEALANGGAFQMHYAPAPAWEGAIEFWRFTDRIAPLLRGARPMADVAIWVPLEQSLLGLPTYPMAWSRILSDLHIAHIFVPEQELEDFVERARERASLSPRVLLIPEAPWMEPEEIEAMRSFVKSGGSLIAVGEVATRDEWGHKLKKSLLSDLLGPEGEVGEPERRRFGRGKVLRLPHLDLPTYARDGIPPKSREAFRWVEENLNWLLDGRPLIQTDAPEWMEIHPWISPDRKRLLLHLVNYHVEATGKVRQTPQVDLKLALPLPVKEALLHVPRSPQPLKLTIQKGRGAGLSLPPIRIYGLLEIRLG